MQLVEGRTPIKAMGARLRVEVDRMIQRYIGKIR